MDAHRARALWSACYEALVEIGDSERALEALRREAVTAGTLTATRDLRTRIGVLERQISGLEFWEAPPTTVAITFILIHLANPDWPSSSFPGEGRAQIHPPSLVGIRGRQQGVRATTRSSMRRGARGFDLAGPGPSPGRNRILNTRHSHLDSRVMQRHLATQGFATLLIDIARAAIFMRAPSLKQDVTLAAARSQWLPKPLKGRR
jgi:hypothetical protein